MYQKIRKTKSVQCLADYLIKVVGGFSVHYQDLPVLCPPPRTLCWSYFSQICLLNGQDVNKMLYSKVTSGFWPCVFARAPCDSHYFPGLVWPRMFGRSRKIQTENHPLSCFGSVGPGCIQSCLPAQKRFLLFKGMRSFKKKVKNRRKCRGM